MNKEQSNRQQGNNELGTRVGDDISARLVAVAAEVIILVGALPRSRAGRHVEDQLVRAGTAGGAHYDEARAAESRADFVHKLRLGTKELRETSYWLRVAAMARLLKQDLSALLREIDELVAILIASARTARLNGRP